MFLIKEFNSIIMQKTLYHLWTGWADFYQHGIKKNLNNKKSKEKEDNKQKDKHKEHYNT